MFRRSPLIAFNVYLTTDDVDIANFGDLAFDDLEGQRDAIQKTDTANML